MPRTVDIVERERERAISKEISFVKLAQNTVFIGTKRIEGTNKKVINKKDELCSKENLLYSLSF